MNIFFPPLDSPFEIKEENINVIVVENPDCLYSLLTNLYAQNNKSEGSVVLSENNKLLDISKKVELIYQFVPFEINKKTLVTKLQNKLKDLAYSELYVETNEISSQIQQYIYKLIDFTDYEVETDEITVSDLIKLSGVKWVSEYETLVEQIYEYCNAVIRLEGEKLFVLYGLKSLVSTKEYEQFMKMCVGHKILILLIEPTNKQRNEVENVLIIDKDLCVI